MNGPPHSTQCIARVGACPDQPHFRRVTRKPVGPQWKNTTGLPIGPWDDPTVSELDALRDRMRQFTEDRDWGQFHDPKSLLLALVGEVGELSELFQWLPAKEAQILAGRDPVRARVGEEMADVLLYLIRLADVLDIDLAVAAAAKLADSERRFPPEKVAGQAPSKA